MMMGLMCRNNFEVIRYSFINVLWKLLCCSIVYLSCQDLLACRLEVDSFTKGYHDREYAMP